MIRNRAKLAWKASTDKKESAVVTQEGRLHTYFGHLFFGPIKVSFYLRIFPILEKEWICRLFFPQKNLLSKILFYKGRSSFNERGCYRLYLRRKCPRRDFPIIVANL
ncbi:hypothetical protein CEXT_292891 [Caerostris extrusa]|uniref:Uncharacterized protein n=1 Tax=Caerostris extrusa TaxID=172846 RepID=A0AAV4PEX6_CAEEX|nr:hypothetical protein CEXT_292891 [Caerostris extrusa]